MTKRIGQFTAACLAAILVAGCATSSRQPQMEHARITPDALKPGDTAIIEARFKDKDHVIARVEGVVKEDPSLRFVLLDDGMPPDKKRADGIWTLQVDVPFVAPPGDFEFNLTAYRIDGTPVLIRNSNGEVRPLTASFGLVIQFPASE